MNNQLNPGTATVCRRCVHLVVDAFDRGHANPCKMNRWEETKHVEPELSSDGQSCGGFEPRAEEPEDVEPVAGALTS